MASSNLSLTYKVPAGDAGLYAVCVTGAAGTQGEYVLSVTGETGALAPVTVTNVNPAAGTLIQSPASVTVDFSQSIYLPSLSASELTITDLTHPGQGTITATGYTVVNDHEVTWYLPSGFNGSSEDNRLDIAGGQIQDLSDVTLAAFSEDFTTDNVAPTVVATSIEEGSILPVGTGNLTYVVTFSQPMDPSNVSTASFDLHGNFLQADYTPVSFSFNPTDTQLTITYANLPNDAYTLTLFSKMAVDGGPITNSNGFCNLVGLGLDGEPHTPRPPSVPSGDGVPGGNFSVDFGLSLGTTAFPVPLQPVNPLGSLIYQGSTTGWIVAPGDFDTFTLNLNPGQTVTVDVTTSSPLLTTVSLIAPDGVTVLGSAAATAYGQEVVLQDVPVPSAGTYSVEIGALSGSEGNYQVSLDLNTALQTAVHGGPEAMGLSCNYYYEGTAQPGTVAEAAAEAGSVTSTFISTLFSGTIYNGGDGSSLPSFLGADGASLYPPPANATLDTSYFDMTGTFNVSAAEAGVATFTLDSDDGSILSIDGVQVVNDDYTHGQITVSGTVDLAPGSHTIELQYFNQYYYGFGGAYLSASGTFANGDPVLDARNDTVNNAQDISSSSVPLSSGADRLGVLGQTNGLSAYYSFPLNAGESVSAAMKLSQPPSSLYGPFTDYGVDTPSCVVLGDLTGNGILDMVSTNYYDGTVAVQLGNGDGTFGAPTYYTCGPDPTQVVLADLNGDGKLDMVVTSNSAGYYWFSPTLAVFLGNGDGTFGAPTYYQAGFYQTSVAVGDLNGDGKPDIVTTNYNNGTISVLFNNGDGTFGPPSQYYVGSEPESVALGDFNGDGNLDIAVACRGDWNGISVLMNEGNGFFGPLTEYYAGMGANTSLAVGDLNGDGKPDIVATNMDWGTVSVLLNNGDGTFGNLSTYNLGSSSYPDSIALGDVNGDGKIDIVVGSGYDSYWGNSQNGVVSVLINNGDGTFGNALNLSSDYGTACVALGDLTGSGALDVVTANLPSYTVSVFMHQSPSLELIGPDQTTVVAKGTPDQSFDSLLANYVATETGTYYLCVSGGGSNTDYSLFVTRDAVIGAEPNDTLAEAQSFGSTHVALGSITSGSDSDYYSFTVDVSQVGQTIHLFTSIPSNGTGEFENALVPGLVLYDASGNVLATGTVTTDGRNQEIYFTPTVVGTYILEVYGVNGTTGEYVLDPVSGPALSPVTLTPGGFPDPGADDRTAPASSSRYFIPTSTGLVTGIALNATTGVLPVHLFAPAAPLVTPSTEGMIPPTMVLGSRSAMQDAVALEVSTDRSDDTMAPLAEMGIPVDTLPTLGDRAFLPPVLETFDQNELPMIPARDVDSYFAQRENQGTAETMCRDDLQAGEVLLALAGVLVNGGMMSHPQEHRKRGGLVSC